MSKFTKEMVDDYADKLLIGLTPEENQMVLEEFDIYTIRYLTSLLQKDQYNKIEDMIFANPEEVEGKYSLPSAFSAYKKYCK